MAFSPNFGYFDPISFFHMDTLSLTTHILLALMFWVQVSQDLKMLLKRLSFNCFSLTRMIVIFDNWPDKILFSFTCIVSSRGAFQTIYNSQLQVICRLKSIKYLLVICFKLASCLSST